MVLLEWNGGVRRYNSLLDKMNRHKTQAEEIFKRAGMKYNKKTKLFSGNLSKKDLKKYNKEAAKYNKLSDKAFKLRKKYGKSIKFNKKTGKYEIDKNSNEYKTAKKNSAYRKAAVLAGLGGGAIGYGTNALAEKTSNKLAKGLIYGTGVASSYMLGRSVRKKLDKKYKN